MKKTARIAISALAACSFTFTATHVSAASRSNASTTPPKLKSGITLTVWDYFGTGSAERATEQKIIAQWATATHNHVDTPQNPPNSNTKMCVNGPAGQGPDLIGVPHDQVAVMQKCGTLAAVPAWAWTPSSKKTYIKAAIQATTLYGKTYAMPWAIETTGLFYNKSLLPASTFKPATGQKYLSWSKLIKSLQTFQANGGGKLPLGWAIDNLYFDYAFISGNGGYVFKYTKKGFDYNQIGLNSKGAVKGIQFLVDLTNNGKYKLIPDSMTSGTADGLFSQGKMAIDLTGPWNEAAFTKANIDYGFVPVPSFDGKTPSRPFSGVQVYALNKFSKHPNEAASLLSYLTKHMQLPEFKSSGRIPVITSLIKSKAVAADPIASGLGKAALAASPMPNIPEMNQVWTPAGNAIGLAEKGKATAADAAAAAVTQIKSDIAKAHGG